MLTGELPLFFGQELRGSDVSGKDDGRNAADKDGGYSFKYEDPAPTSEASYSIHLENCGCQKT